MSKLIELLRRHEGLRLNAYRCPGGVWTIGWGHTEAVKEGDYIDVDAAERLLRADAAEVGRQVDSLAAEAGVTLGANRRDALVSFAFNVGIGSLRRSTLWKLVCANPSDPAIAREFDRWVYGGGKVLPGLVTRRREESQLYFTPDEP